jgi:hypothetical protein
LCSSVGPASLSPKNLMVTSGEIFSNCSVNFLRGIGEPIRVDTDSYVAAPVPVALAPDRLPEAVTASRTLKPDLVQIDISHREMPVVWMAEPRYASRHALTRSSERRNETKRNAVGAARHRRSNLRARPRIFGDGPTMTYSLAAVHRNMIVISMYFGNISGGNAGFYVPLPYMKSVV